MTTEEKMTIDERRKYLKVMKKRYSKAGRKERGQLLDEMEAVTGLHRKSLIRLLKGSLERKPRSKQRGRTYGAEVEDALRVIVEVYGELCPERLAYNLAWMASHLNKHDEMEVSAVLKEKLEQVSPATVGRILSRIRQDQPRLSRRGSRAPQVRRDIPTRRIPWDEQEPGHFEVDLVHHCGVSASGEYVHTLQMVDVATGWSECRAVLGRSYLVMQHAFACILARLPFAVQEIHPDNGSEFLNHHLIRFWKEAVKGVELSRSRPYQKNDNRFVEQKNSSQVRAYLGYDRLDTVAQTHAVNRFYDKMWLYYNFFQPVMRLQEKTIIRVPGQPTKIKRRFDQAHTPLDRLCAAAAISSERQQQLQILRDRTNPRRLRQELFDALDHIFTLPTAVPGVTEDVYQTLSSHLDLVKGAPHDPLS